MTPWPTTPIDIPVVYSPSTNGSASREVAIAPLLTAKESVLSKFIEKHRGKLKGKFILLQGAEHKIPRDYDPMYRLYSESDMRFQITASTKGHHIETGRTKGNSPVCQATFVSGGLIPPGPGVSIPKRRRSPRHDRRGARRGRYAFPTSARNSTGPGRVTPAYARLGTRTCQSHH